MTPWTVAHQGPLSKGFPRQEYWSKFPFTTPGDLPNPRIKSPSHASPTLQEDSLPLDNGSDGKESACNAADLGSILGWEDSLEESMVTHSKPLLYSCLENPHEQRSLAGYNHRVAKGQT